MKNVYVLIKTLLISFVISGMAYGQALTFEFTNAGATGRFGPTQAQINTAYASTNLAGQVTSVNGIQYWVVPFNGLFSIEAVGGQGFGQFGGRGARMKGDFMLTGGDTLKILVGQQGAPPVGSGTNQYGGGGGSFVTTMSNTPLVVAGGGGGSWASAFNTTTDASLTTSGNAGGGSGATGGAGGTNGQGGLTNSSGDGGGGLLGNGTGTASGFAFVNGGNGGIATSSGGEGGFGGGGGASSWDNRRGGGGGGYSGGGGAHGGTTGFPEGGGGGSFNSGADQDNQAGFGLGHGYVKISPRSGLAPNDAGIREVTAPIDTLKCKTPQSIEVLLENHGTAILNSCVVNWSIDSVVQTPVTFNGSIDTLNGSNPNTANFTVGSFAFTQSGTYELTVWTTLPNGVADTINFNDTFTTHIHVQLLDVFVEAQTNVSCNGGSNGTVLVNSASSTATYAWNTGQTSPLINNLAAGTYTVTVTDINNCPDTFQVVITEPDPVGFQITSGGFAPCNGDNGSVTIEGTGGTPPYSYLFMGAIPTNSLNNIVPGRYGFRVTDANNCMFEDSVSIINPPVLNTEVNDIVPSGCDGSNGSATATANGGIPPYSYSWSNGATGASVSGLSRVTYEVSITDSIGCTQIHEVEIRSVDVSLTVTSPIIGANNPNATYQWFNCTTGQLITGQTSQFYQPTAPGSYGVIVTEGACSDSSACVTVTNTSVLPLNAKQMDITVYPNPNNGQFMVQLNSSSTESIQIEVFDMQGKLHLSRKVDDVQNNRVIELNTQLAPGVYFLKTYNAAFEDVKRVVIQ